MLSKLLGKEVETSGELTLQDWRSIRDRAYPNWPDGDWGVGNDFELLGHRLVRQYEEEVLGQKNLF